VPQLAGGRELHDTDRKNDRQQECRHSIPDRSAVVVCATSSRGCMQEVRVVAVVPAASCNISNLLLRGRQNADVEQTNRAEASEANSCCWKHMEAVNRSQKRLHATHTIVETGAQPHLRWPHELGQLAARVAGGDGAARWAGRQLQEPLLHIIRDLGQPPALSVDRDPRAAGTRTTVGGSMCVRTLAVRESDEVCPNGCLTAGNATRMMPERVPWTSTTRLKHNCSELHACQTPRKHADMALATVEASLLVSTPTAAAGGMQCPALPRYSHCHKLQQYEEPCAARSTVRLQKQPATGCAILLKAHLVAAPRYSPVSALVMRQSLRVVSLPSSAKYVSSRTKSPLQHQAAAAAAHHSSETGKSKWCAMLADGVGSSSAVKRVQLKHTTAHKHVAS
jgi:hypothetical protein